MSLIKVALYVLIVKNMHSVSSSDPCTVDQTPKENSGLKILKQSIFLLEATVLINEIIRTKSQVFIKGKNRKRAKKVIKIWQIYLVKIEIEQARAGG